MTINNEIEENYCSLDVSKLLKERGFNCFTEATWTVYHQDTEYNNKGNRFEEKGILHGRNERQNSNQYYSIYSAPTHSIAIEWMRINYGLHIYADYNSLHKWFYCILDLNDEGRIDASRFNSPEEAIEAALEEALKVGFNRL